MISAEESRKIAELARIKKDPIRQKTQYIWEHLESYINDAAKRGDTKFRISFDKPIGVSCIVSYGMGERELFNIFVEHVAPRLRELGYFVETIESRIDYEIFIKW